LQGKKNKQREECRKSLNSEKKGVNRFVLNEDGNSNTGLETKSHETLDEIRQPDKTKFEIVRLEGFIFGWFKMPPIYKTFFSFDAWQMASDATSAIYFAGCDREINFQLIFMKTFLKRLL